METLSINSNEVKQWRSSILIPEASDSRECFEKYSSKSFGSGMFFIPNTGKYNQAVAVLYEKFSPSEMKVGIAKFEELIVPIMLRYNDGNEMIDLGEVLDKMPIQDFHVLLPIYNIQITDDVIRIGGYSVVKYQYIADYFKSIGITMRGKYTQDPYFNYVPFVDFVITGRDNSWAMEKAKAERSLLINYLNMMLFSNIRGIDVISETTDAGSSNRSFIGTLTSFSVSMSTSHPMVKRFDIGEAKDWLNREENGSRKMLAVCKTNGGSELEKRVVNAINWVGMAVAEKNNAIAITQATYAVESLLQNQIQGEPISKSIVASIGEMVAFLLGNNYDSRKQWEKQFKETYGLRSKVAHGKGQDITNDQVLTAIGIAYELITTIVTKPQFKEAKTIQAINNYVEKMRYAYSEEEQ